MEQIGYQIVHSIAGRIRIRVSWLETDVESAGKYQKLLEALSHVNNVRINPLAHSIVIEYNPKRISIAEAEERFISVMQQVKLTPPIQTTTIETPPEPESDEPESVSDSSQPTPPPVQSSVIPEIPSPWDEFVPIEPPNAVEPMSLPPPHSAAALAARLKVTSQAITRRRTKADFQTWTQAQDPERIAWHYVETSRSFHPVLISEPRLDSHKRVDSIDEKCKSTKQNSTRSTRTKSRSMNKKK